MLTADLVSARRRGKQLVLSPMDVETRLRALGIAAELVSRARGLVGQSREDVEAAMKSLDVAPREHRLRDGLTKLILDRCEFDSPEDIDVPALRREVFSRASSVRALFPSWPRLLAPARSALIPFCADSSLPVCAPT